MNATNVGRSDMPAARTIASARGTSAARCPFASASSTRSDSDSTALTTNSAPAAASSGISAACATMCSTFAVKLKVTSGCAACSAARDAQRVRRPVEKIGIAEVDVARAGGDLRARVVEHDVGGNGEEAPAVHGRNRTVPAQVLAAARRLDVTGDARSSAIARRAYFVERGQAARDRAPATAGGPAGAVRRTARRRRSRSTAASATSCGSQSGPSTLSASAASSARFSVAYMPKKQRCARGFARRTCAATRRPSTSAVCIGTEIATKRAAARRARAASSSGSTARSRQVGWKPARAQVGDRRRHPLRLVTGLVARDENDVARSAHGLPPRPLVYLAGGAT